VLEPELFGDPKRLLDVDRVDSAPDLQHLETYRLTVAARIADGEVAAVEFPHHLRAAELVVVVDGDDAVAAALQLLERGVREAIVLDADVHPGDEAEARAVARRLRVL